MNPHATDVFSQSVQECGPAGTVDKLHHQLDTFWQHEHPFNRLTKDGNALAWWQALKHHPGAQVLAALMIKVFSALVNSMPDEWTGSTFTWLNSPIHGNQNAQTLTDMVRIGQWYQDYAQAHAPAKVPFHPMVKFCDINKDLLAGITSAGTQTTDPGDLVPDGAIYDSDNGDNGDVGDDFLESGDEVGNPHSMFVATTVEADNDMDLDNPFLLDLISPTLIAQPTIHLPQHHIQPVSKDDNPNWDCKVQKKLVPFVNEATTLHHHLQAYHKADYLQWAVANKFASMLPWDTKCCHKDALLHVQSTFCEVTIHWLINTDQPIQALQDPDFKVMIDIASNAPATISVKACLDDLHPHFQSDVVKRVLGRGEDT
ncbi:hypothetical protein EDC04DRAFT_2890709 [Pisolithus marmoratus]|nr:hypothetical protein EDC04DRAFT_2890709 [Pisolithus marmoratus]